LAGAEAGEVGYLLELAGGDIDAVDGLGGRHEGVNVDGFAIGAPDGIGYGGFGEETPGAGGDVEEHEAALVEGDGSDVAAVGGPAGGEEAFGAGNRSDGMGAEVEDLDGAGTALFAHKIGDAAEDEGLAVGGPVGIAGVAFFRIEGLGAAAIGRDGVELPGLAGLAGHDGELFAVGGPVGEEDLHGVGGELEFFFAVDAGTPETALGVGPGDPLLIVGVVDAVGLGEEVVFGKELVPVGVVTKEFGSCIEAEEEDAVAGAGGDGGLVAEGAVGDADGAGDVFAAELPEVFVAVAGGLEEEVFAVGGPCAAAFGGRFVPSAEDGARGMGAGGELPEGHGVGEGVDDGEAEEAAVG